MTSDSGLTRGRIVSLVRLSSVISLLLIAAAIALQFAPLERPPSPSDLVNATPRQSSGEGDFFTSYSAMLGVRNNPFEFGQVNRAQVRFQVAEQVPVAAPVAQQPPAPPPPPQPDVEGLQLVGTMPGTRHAYALFRDEQSGLVQTFALGEEVRNSVLAQIFDDRVELALAEQKVELALAQIADGSGAASPPVATNSPAQAPSRPPGSSRRKPSLGLSGHMLAPADVERFGLTGGDGLMVTGVRRSDGLIQVDDVILAADGQKFRSTKEFVALMTGKGAGTPIELSLLRKNQRLSVTIMLL